MTKFKSKLISLAIIFILGIIAIQTSVNASNENVQILKKSTGDYILYIKDNLNVDFEFAFSNDVSPMLKPEDFYSAEKDSTDTNANKVAFVNSTIYTKYFADPAKNTYMWVKVGASYILEGIEIDLSKAINEKDLKYAADLTKIIKVDTTKTDTKEETIDGKKVITTVGKVALPEEGDYFYVLIKDPTSEDYKNLTELATRVSKLNSKTDMYKQIQIYSEFFNKFKSLIPENSEWTELKENEILQPEDSEDGQKYILWIKDESKDGLNIDIQFLTSHKEYSEEKIIEKITTKLPVTYDNNTLLIVFVVLIVAIIVVCIRIKMLNKKEK